MMKSSSFTTRPHLAVITAPGSSGKHDSATSGAVCNLCLMQKRLFCGIAWEKSVGTTAASLIQLNTGRKVWQFISKTSWCVQDSQSRHTNLWAAWSPGYKWLTLRNVFNFHSWLTSQVFAINLSSSSGGSAESLSTDVECFSMLWTAQMEPLHSVQHSAFCCSH